MRDESAKKYELVEDLYIFVQVRVKIHGSRLRPAGAATAVASAACALERKLLHIKAFTQRFFTQSSFYTQKLSHTDAFTQRCLYIEKCLHRGAFTHRSFCTEKSFQTEETFTQRSPYTEELVHTDTLNIGAFTRRSFLHRELLHREPLPQRTFVTSQNHNFEPVCAVRPSFLAEGLRLRFQTCNFTPAFEISPAFRAKGRHATEKSRFTARLTRTISAEGLAPPTTACHHTFDFRRGLHRKRCQKQESRV